jgi:hypothetical protein
MITNPVLPAPTGGSPESTGVTFLQNAIPKAIILGFVVGVVIFFFMLIIGAIQWIISGGDKQSVENARGRVTNAIIGLFILFMVFAILQLINTFFNVQILNLTIPTLTGP